jgi:hypothetical protein
MKNILFLFSFLFASQTFSQLQILDKNLPVNNGDTITQIYYGPELIILMYTDLKIKNTGSTTQKVVVKVDRSEMFPLTEEGFCWAGNCYGHYLDQSEDTATISANTTNTTFQGKYYPNDIPNAISFVTFTFIDPSQPADSAWVVCKYGQFHENIASLNESSIDTPYKVAGGKITINSDCEIHSICNLLGENISINPDYQLERGVYFLTLRSKETIQHHTIYIE